MPDNPRSTARIMGHPLHAMLVPFPIVCFIGALITDITYAKTYNMQWANFSAWLLTAGLVISLFVVIAGLIDFFGSRAIRAVRLSWFHASSAAVVLILQIFNVFVHSRDAYTSVVPTGLTLSIIAVVIMLFTAWMGGSLVFRHRIGVSN